MNSNRLIVGIASLLLLAGLSGGGYYFFRNFTITKQKKTVPQESVQSVLPEPGETTTIRLYYPLEGRLEISEKAIPRRTRPSLVAEALVEEYFKQPAAAKSPEGQDPVVPANVKLLGSYRDANQVLYIDLSDEVRRNFHSDAGTEYLLLKGLYETILSNMSDVADVKVLVEGKEIETLGGHMLLKFPLKNLVGYEIRGETKLPYEQ